MHPQKTPQFIAVVDNVREVSLAGLADAGCWSSLLRGVGLQLARRDGRAQILLSAVQARYMGLPFRELSVSLGVRHPDDEGQGSCFYLAYAFHSSRFLAFIERNCFRTPYYPARIEVDTQTPVSFAANRRDGAALTASMGRDTSGPREPIRCGHDSWEGPIFLPQSKAGDHRRRRWFAAKLAGDTHVYPFLPTRDEVVIRPSPRCPVLQRLAESKFAGREWIVRESAIHARSKTYKEVEALRVAKVDAPVLESPGYG
jgi:hypothetical protein